MISLAPSYHRNHRNSKPVVLASIGFTLFILGKIFHYEMVEIALSVLGGSFVVSAHFINLRLNKRMSMG
jgi:hypothetical protein